MERCAYCSGELRYVANNARHWIFVCDYDNIPFIWLGDPRMGDAVLLVQGVKGEDYASLLTDWGISA